MAETSKGGSCLEKVPQDDGKPKQPSDGVAEVEEIGTIVSTEGAGTTATAALPDQTAQLATEEDPTYDDGGKKKLRRIYRKYENCLARFKSLVRIESQVNIPPTVDELMGILVELNSLELKAERLPDSVGEGENVERGSKKADLVTMIGRLQSLIIQKLQNINPKQEAVSPPESAIDSIEKFVEEARVLIDNNRNIFGIYDELQIPERLRQPRPSAYLEMLIRVAKPVNIEDQVVIEDAKTLTPKIVAAENSRLDTEILLQNKQERNFEEIQTFLKIDPNSYTTVAVVRAAIDLLKTNLDGAKNQLSKLTDSLHLERAQEAFVVPAEKRLIELYEREKELERQEREENERLKREDQKTANNTEDTKDNAKREEFLRKLNDLLIEIDQIVSDYDRDHSLAKTTKSQLSQKSKDLDNQEGDWRTIPNCREQTGKDKQQTCDAQIQVLIKRCRDKIQEEIKRIDGNRLEDIPLEELVDEVLRLRINPFEHREFGTAEATETRTYYMAVASRILNPPNDREETSAERLIRVTQKVRLALLIFNRVNTIVAGQATSDQSKIIDFLVNSAGVTREELVMATSAHPEYGSDLKKIWENLMLVASLNNGQVVVRRTVYQTKGGELLYLPPASTPPSGAALLRQGIFWRVYGNEVAPGEAIIARYNEKIAYTPLASVKGREFLEEWLGDNISEENKYRNLLIQLIANIFYATDQLSTCAAHATENTLTVSHRNGLPDVDMVALLNPLGKLEHSLERYGESGPPNAWILAFIPDLPISNSIGKPLTEEEKRLAYEAFGKWKDAHHRGPITEDEKVDWIQTMIRAEQDGFFNDELSRGIRFYPSQLIRNMQRLIKMYLNCYFDISMYAGYYPTLGIDETLFPPLSSAFFLFPGETLDQLRGPKARDLTLWETAFRNNAEWGGGWTKILDIYYARIPEVTAEDIALAQTKSPKGLLSEWLALWGQAKMWPGRHMEMFAPMTIEYIYRLAQAYPERDSSRRRRLWKAIKQQLASAKSGGLSNISKQVEIVEGAIGVEEINPNLSLHFAQVERTKQRKPYLTAYKWYRETEDDKMPTTVGLGALQVGIFNSQSSKKVALQQLRGKQPLPSPAARKNR